MFDRFNKINRLMVWTAYLDESGTHDSPVMLLGGHLANEQQWKAFDSAWKSLLDSEGVTSCHGKDLRHSAKQFKGWPRQRRDSFVRKSHKIVSETLECGFTAIIRKNDYNSLYKRQPNPHKLREDSMYGVLFRGCLLLVELAVTGNKVPPPDLRLNFIIEGGNKNSGDVTRLFELAKKEHLPGCEHVLGTMTFGNKDVYGLQAADFLVYSANILERKDQVRNVTIENGKVAGFYYGIYFSNGSGDPANNAGQIVENMRITHCSIAVQLNFGSGCLIRNNYINGFSTRFPVGVCLDGGGGNQLIRNRVLNCYEGIATFGGNSLESNFVYNCAFGLDMDDSD
jgi:hypothetical protein